MSIILEVKNICKTYHSSLTPVEAVKPVTIFFSEGEFVALVGKSGSGKSTFLQMLGTALVPDQGEVLLRGRNVLNLSDDELSSIRRNEIAMIYQDYNLFPEFTAFENIILPIHLDDRKEDREEVLKVMEDLGISHCKEKFPTELSGGEKQRVAIARAICQHPAIILADEPTGNLDAENSQEVILLLSKAARLYNQTILMVTHDRQSAEYADRMIHIVDGVITE